MLLVLPSLKGFLYGFTIYSSQLANLELAMENHVWYGPVFFVTAGVLLTLSWRRHPGASAARFDASESRWG